MGEMIIQLRRNPTTGKRDIIVDLRSDADALPHEHEQQHRQLVNKLIEGGILAAEEAGEIVVIREEEDTVPTEPQREPDLDQRQAEAQGQ